MPSPTRNYYPSPRSPWDWGSRLPAGSLFHTPVSMMVWQQNNPPSSTKRRPTSRNTCGSPEGPVETSVPLSVSQRDPSENAMTVDPLALSVHSDPQLEVSSTDSAPYDYIAPDIVGDIGYYVVRNLLFPAIRVVVQIHKRSSTTQPEDEGHTSATSNTGGAQHYLSSDSILSGSLQPGSSYGNLREPSALYPSDPYPSLPPSTLTNSGNIPSVSNAHSPDSQTSTMPGPGNLNLTGEPRSSGGGRVQNARGGRTAAFNPYRRPRPNSTENVSVHAMPDGYIIYVRTGGMPTDTYDGF
ncbi:hypothetical protein OF83DRAFT_351617 [Amylostereum chailletii]|nr:hypothetical protein OF83DRAFT_351617 [Amylostereum chailletii]